MGDQCSFEIKVPFNVSSNRPSIRAAIAFVARMKSGEAVENIDCGASPRIPAWGLHPGYEKQGMGDQCSCELKVPFNVSSNRPSIRAAIAFVARMKSGEAVENIDCGASPRIPACGLHPGYEKQGMGDQCPPEPKCPLSSSSNCPSISAAIAFVARISSGEAVENIDCGASPRIPAWGLHPGYEKQGMGDQCPP
jgi:hypothetical protein